MSPYLYLTCKTLHIISAIVLLGTGFGSAFYWLVTHWDVKRQKQPSLAALVSVTRWVVRADWYFTTPSMLLQPLTGIYLAWGLGYSWQTVWLRWAIFLYIFAGLCWLPVVWIQIKMRHIVRQSFIQNNLLPSYYWRLQSYWIFLGCAAFTAMLPLVALMVFKPI